MRGKLWHSNGWIIPNRISMFFFFFFFFDVLVFHFWILKIFIKSKRKTMKLKWKLKMLTRRPSIWFMAADSFNVHSATTFARISFIYNINAFNGFLICGFFFSLICSCSNYAKNPTRKKEFCFNKRDKSRNRVNEVEKKVLTIQITHLLLMGLMRWLLMMLWLRVLWLWLLMMRMMLFIRFEIKKIIVSISIWKWFGFG